MSGEAVFTPAWLEPENGFGPNGVQVRAEPDADAFVISGTKRHVAFASAATRLVVLARTGDGFGDVDLFLVDPAADGVTLTQQMSIASDAQYRVDLDRVRVTPADRIGAAGTGWATWDAVMHDGIILAAAQAVGGAQHAMEITVQYAKDRHQFDKPLGAFQALAHYLADGSTTVDGAEVLVHEAAWARSEGRDVAKLAPMAKLFACQTFRDVTAMAQQSSGASGSRSSSTSSCTSAGPSSSSCPGGTPAISRSWWRHPCLTADQGEPASARGGGRGHRWPHGCATVDHERPGRVVP